MVSSIVGLCILDDQYIYVIAIAMRSISLYTYAQTHSGRHKTGKGGTPELEMKSQKEKLGSEEIMVVLQQKVSVRANEGDGFMGFKRTLG